MSKQQWLSLIGIWVVFFLFLGFPPSIEKILAICTGILIVLISFKGISKKKSSGISESRHPGSYVENSGENSNKN